jgi:hypothetical protein
MASAARFVRESELEIQRERRERPSWFCMGAHSKQPSGSGEP